MSSGVITTFFIVVFMFSFIYIIFSSFIDTLVDEIINLTPALSTSQSYLDIINTLLDFWAAIPFVIILYSLFYLIKTSLKERADEV